eukprot:8313760-Heterocapsa_arctica.AAC.1
MPTVSTSTTAHMVDVNTLDQYFNEIAKLRADILEERQLRVNEAMVNNAQHTIMEHQRLSIVEMVNRR